MSYADIGLDTIAGYRSSPDPQPPTPDSSQDHIGFTAPELIWERMKQIDVSADNLDAAIKTNIQDPSFVTGWSSWLKSWKAMVAKYDGYLARVTALTYSDDLAAQVESERQALLRWERSYKLEGLKQNQTLPNVPGGMPSDPSPPPPKKPSGWMPSLEVPWWAWALGIGAIAGLGALVYHRIKVTRADPRMHEMLSRYGPPSQSQIDAARIEAMKGASSYLSAGRDPSEDVRYQIGGGYGVRMCPCPNHGSAASPVFDPEV